MDQGSLLEQFAQVRRQLMTLCAKDRYSAAHMFLVGSGMTPSAASGLWEYVARRANEAGHHPIAHELRKTLWKSDIRNDDIALQEAQYFLGRKDYENCCFVIEAQFGSVPDDPTALALLTRAYMLMARSQTGLSRLRTNREIALRLTRAVIFATADHAAAAIDLLRFSGEIDRAFALTHQARNEFPDDIRFQMREARIEEQKGKFDRAIALWSNVADTSDRYRLEALFKLYGLYERLEQESAGQKIAARLLLMELPIDRRIQLALLMGQPKVLHALVKLAALGGARDAPLHFEQGLAIGDLLLDHGYIGLVLWLRRQRMPLGDRLKATLDACQFGDRPDRAMPDSFEEAVSLRSPDFMLPLDRFAPRAPKPPGWPGSRSDPGRILLVNSSLKAGGAERQFVALVRALCEAGVDRENIHVGLFNLDEDRRMDHFLPDLRALGVKIHDLARRQVSNPQLPHDVGHMVNALPSQLKYDLRPLWYLVQELRPNVIHGWQDRSAAVCGLVAHMAETERVVLSMRNMTPQTRYDRNLMALKPLLSSYLEKPNFVLTANSKLGATDYAEWLNVRQVDVGVMTNAVDIAPFARVAELKKTTRPKDAPLRVGGVFRFALNKRPLLWLETVAALRNHLDIDVEPRLYGEGPMEAEMQRYADDLGLGSLRLVSGEADPAKLYSDMDVLLLMSRVEGVPNVLLEAQASGLPVAVCRVGGVEEAVQNRGDSAALVMEPDVSAAIAAKSIADWLPNALAAEHFPRVGFVRTHFSPEVLAKQALRYYCGQGDV